MGTGVWMAVRMSRGLAKSREQRTTKHTLTHTRTENRAKRKRQTAEKYDGPMAPPVKPAIRAEAALIYYS